jgi:peptidoglycan/xylan/chitin deacetylase (PgdA/CDA1 family)
MKKKATRQPHHIFRGFVSVIVTFVIGIGVISLLSYLSIENYRHDLTAFSPKPSVPPRTIGTPMTLTITPTIQPNTTDTHVPPIVDGLAPIVYDLPTNKPVVFLTIDDGANKTPDELQAILDNHLQVTLFLSALFTKDNPQFFNDFQKSGNLIEDHTMTHPLQMREMSYDQQKAEICGMADYELQHYGRRPTLYRPPGGAYSTVMQKAAADCGMKAIVTWIAKANGGSMQYQIGDHLRPGDIVLMHFRPEFQKDLKAFLDAMNQQKLHTELLENWLQ